MNPPYQSGLPGFSIPYFSPDIVTSERFSGEKADKIENAKHAGRGIVKQKKKKKSSTRTHNRIREKGKEHEHVPTIEFVRIDLVHTIEVEKGYHVHTIEVDKGKFVHTIEVVWHNPPNHRNHNRSRS